MTPRQLQRQIVDAIKRHAIALSIDSPRAQKRILTEYLWNEEGAESTALGRIDESAPRWLARMLARQLQDEQRHATLLRERLGEMGVEQTADPPPLARLKLWWLERACAPYARSFTAGPVVVVLAAAAQLEQTGVRVFGRHLAVLEERERSTGEIDPTAAVLRSIIADEQRHARSCAAAAERLVSIEERPDLDALRERVAQIDRAFGVTLAGAYWLLVASLVVRDRRRR